LQVTRIVWHLGWRLRVTARLDDGSTAEDAAPLNASDLGERIDVRRGSSVDSKNVRRVI
jgi:hypothetical protein